MPEKPTLLESHYLTNTSPGHYKFYLINIWQYQGIEPEFVVETRWGRIGLIGKAKYVGKNFLSPALSLKNRQNAKKVSKGYRPTACPPYLEVPLDAYPLSPETTNPFSTPEPPSPKILPIKGLPTKPPSTLAPSITHMLRELFH